MELTVFREMSERVKDPVYKLGGGETVLCKLIHVLIMFMFISLLIELNCHVYCRYVINC